MISVEGFLVLVFAIAFVYLLVKNSEQSSQLFEKETDIEKEKLKNKLRNKNFYELVEMRDFYKIKCKKLKETHESKVYNNIEFRENYALYKAYSELALEKFNEKKHSSWFRYYDDETI